MPWPYFHTWSASPNSTSQLPAAAAAFSLTVNTFSYISRPIVNQGHNTGFLLLKLCRGAQRHKVLVLLGNLCAFTKHPDCLQSPHTDLWGSIASTLPEKCVHGSLTEHHTPISTSVLLCVCVCLCCISLSHRAIIQLQSQRQVAGCVIFDKLCWLPHLGRIWEPYTGILMDREGDTGSEPFNH